MRTRPQSISQSYWAGRLALFSVALIVVAGAFHRLFGMSTPLALNLFAIAFLFSVLALAFGGYGLVRIWQTGLRGTATALAGMAIAGLVLCWPLSQVPKLRALPTLNDVTTDTTDPPPFIELAKLRPKGANPVAYPGPAAAALQNEAYRDLKPLVLRRTVDDAFDLVGLTLRRLRMTTVNAIPAIPGRGNAGLVEAYDRTLILGFYDDISVRVRAVRGGSRIDVRSASRYGAHDLGRNADRVRAILNEIVAQAEGSVPGRGRGLRNRQRTSDNKSPGPVERPAIRRP